MNPPSQPPPPPPESEPEPEPCTRNWLELPKDVTISILQRLGAVEIMESVQLVCTTWRSVCKDPSMWRSIDMSNRGEPYSMPHDLEIMCRNAVDRSSGHLLHIIIQHFGTDELLHYIAERASNLKSLKLGLCYEISPEGLSNAIKKMPLLEELELSYCCNSVTSESLETIGRSCPLLQSLKWNDQAALGGDSECDGEAMAIGKTMPGLRHLQLVGNFLTNNGLQAILDGCPHLESLDLRQCSYVKLDGSLGKRCAERVKVLKKPDDSTADYPYDAQLICFDALDGLSDYGYDGCDDDFDGYDGFDGYDSDLNYTGKFSASGSDDDDERFFFY
ncbi:hypothetical protein Tsubulata_035730 [Turnera subulata]|uniref:F-box domain-containing protein n=1 Tax=Turnera subulata TaxID=218843 RepID=A0A9Q0J9Z1_9ROSI|nr:hypothetical protein Tsubulata_035730 [Turnera subulata]